MDSKGMLSKVRAMLDTAESLEESAGKPHTCETCTKGVTDHPGDQRKAAATYRAKAEALRRKYQIEEEELIASDPTSVLPVYEELFVSGQSKFQQEYVNMFAGIARHAGIRVTFGWDYNGSGYNVVAKCVGYEGDMRYADLLFTNARVVFAERLEPKVLPHLDEQVNVYRLRASGMERVRVAEAMWGNREKASLAKVGRLYKAECAKRGEEALLSGRGVTGAVYREQYANEFTWTLERRLRRAQDAAGQYGGGLVLHGRQGRVNEAFYERFPNLRPKPALPVGDPTPTPCEACARAKVRTKDDEAQCRDCKPRKLTKKDLARYDRHNSPAAQRGRAAGATAAAYVELNRTGTSGLEG